MIEKNNNKLQKNIFKALLVIAIFTTASVIGYIFRRAGFPDTNIVVVYLLAILVTVWVTNSFLSGFLASVAATLAFNYFFVAPLLAFSVHNPNYIITFITMIFTAFATSILTSHVKRGIIMAQEKEAEATAIYNLTNHLTAAQNINDIANIAVSAISEYFFCNAACLCYDENGVPERTLIQKILDDNQIKQKNTGIREIEHQMEESRAEFEIGAEFYDWPIRGRESTLGIIRIPKEKAETMNETKMRLLCSMVESTALAMDRFRAAEQRIKSREETVKERYRSNLLRAISHDLRTPLSGIIGTSEMLMDMTKSDDPCYKLARGIQKDAEWLRSLVENILNLTRLQDGKLVLQKQPEAVEEVISEAVSHMARRSPEYEIEVSVPDELLIAPMDARLIVQVLINLLDNSVKHTGPENEISVAVRQNKNTNMAEFTVKDRGDGIRENDLPYIFQSFYTSDVVLADAAHGIGLGLAICETIVKAHDGSIGARNRTDGSGAEFIFTLPMEENNDEQI